VKIARRNFLRIAAAATLPALPRLANAQAYPARPVHMVVGFPGGQAADIIARLVCQPLSERLGQQFVVDDRPGAGGNIGTEVVVRAAPDGYTLLTCLLTNAINATLYADLTFNFIRDTAPVANIVSAPYVMAINPAVPAQNVAEFIAYAKANPGKINMGSAGIGTPPHVFGELFQMTTDISMVHVPYRGAYVPDLMSGQVQVVFSPIPTTIAQIRAGKLRALGVTSARRSQALPDTPAIAEFVPGYDAAGWYGVSAPKGTPAAIVEKLNTEINAITTDPTTKARLIDLGAEPMPMTPAEFGKFTADETEKWAKVVRAANIKPE
jgi:tripartite-type tricarboxylate transporter receptor subunit TctC